MRSSQRYIGLAIFTAVALYTILLLRNRNNIPQALRIPYGTVKVAPPPRVTPGAHPVHELVAHAEKEFQKLQAKQSKTLKEAVTEYRRRYGMPPPPNFDKWFEFAQEKNVQLIDEFDTIYHSLLPFWTVEPSVLRERVRRAIGFDNAMIAVLIRDGKVTKMEGGGEMYKWHRDATPPMLRHFIQYLPDMDLAFNVHDEPRIVMQHDDLDRHVRVATSQNIPRLQKARSLKNTWSPRPKDLGTGQKIKKYKTTQFNVFAHQPAWSNSKISCPLDSAARCLNDTCIDDTATYTQLPLGIIQNTTAFSDVCNSPSFETSFGFFDRPNAFDVAHDLIPVFSQSKVSSFQDILYPSPWYHDRKVEYHSIYDVNWESKHPKMFWRGSTTGGFSRNGGWRRQHRQRFVLKTLPDNPNNPSLLTLDKETRTWQETSTPMQNLAHYYDVKFTLIGQCDPDDCDAQKEVFEVTNPVNMFEALTSKYLLDIDGNAFSGRYYAWLLSNSLVFKLALFREWHDEWLKPWVHYVPLSIKGDEYSELMRFFSEDEIGRPIARRLADQGKDWAEKVLRNADIEVWYFRLLLEYGRLVDDDRYNLGFEM